MKSLGLCLQICKSWCSEDPYFSSFLILSPVNQLYQCQLTCSVKVVFGSQCGQLVTLWSWFPNCPHSPQIRWTENYWEIILVRVVWDTLCMYLSLLDWFPFFYLPESWGGLVCSSLWGPTIWWQNSRIITNASYQRKISHTFFHECRYFGFILCIHRIFFCPFDKIKCETIK